MARRRRGFWYAFAEGVLRPPMAVLTRRDWEGTENLEQDGGGIIVAANHLSWFDPIVIAHVLNNNDRPPRFLAKEAVFRIPVAGAIIGGAGQIPVYRESRDAARAVRAAVDAVKAGECVVVYPEGTITRDPDLWPMSGKTGAARIALMSGRPVIPLAHWGAQDVMGPYQKEFKALPRKTMRVKVGPPVDLSDLEGRSLVAETLRIATDRILDAITGLLADIRGEQPPEVRFKYRGKDGADSNGAGDDPKNTDRDSGRDS
ncbi:MAG: lysophospholipid acyltransferase family protein [Candidatus Nanopelagicales bacterium]